MATPTAPRDKHLDVVLPELIADLRKQQEKHREECLLAEQRHQLESPALEDAFAHLAIDHPECITYDPNWRPGGTA